MLAPVRQCKLRLSTFTSEPFLSAAGPVLFLAALCGWALDLLASSPALEALVFFLTLGLSAVPIHLWLHRQHKWHNVLTYYTLGANGLLTLTLPFLPLGLRLLSLVAQGALAAVAGTLGLAQLRASLGKENLGVGLGAVSCMGILAGWAVQELTSALPFSRGEIAHALLFTVAALAMNKIPPAEQDVPKTQGQVSDYRTGVVAVLVCVAGALISAQALPPGGTRPTTVLFGLVGAGLCAYLLHAGHDALCSKVGAGAAILASLISPAFAGPLSGLALGLLTPLPAYVVLVKLQSGGAVLPLIAIQGAVPALLYLQPGILPVSDHAMLGTSLLLVLSLSIDTSPQMAGAIEPAAFPPEPAQPNDPLAKSSSVPAEAAPELLRAVFGEVLTPRELQVGQLAILGVASREIAAQLFLTESTVKTHLKNLYRKTETANRNDLYRRLMSAVSAEKAAPPGAVRYVAVLESGPRDALTGLLSRQTFDQVAPERIMVELAHHRHAAILLMALRVGNGNAELKEKALAVVSGILQASLRDGDLLFRYGEEEFAAILPTSDSTGAQYAGRRLADRVRAWAANHPLGLTFSVGWASTEDGAQTVGPLLAEAQRRMAG